MTTTTSASNAYPIFWSCVIIYMVLRLKSGDCTVSLTTTQQHCTPSVVLNTLDEDEEEDDVVDLPAFIEPHLPHIPSILDKFTAAAGGAASCFPGLADDAAPRHTRFRHALAWLKTCQFLDIPFAVEMLCMYTQDRLSECRTVDDLVELMFGAEAWGGLSAKEQRACYDVLFKNFTTFTAVHGRDIPVDV